MQENKRYSLIVIGTGIPGLSTALTWSKIYSLKKHPVLILEKNSIPGGCVTTFARKGYHFDTTRIIPDISELLHFFEIDIPLGEFENYYARLFLANPKERTTKIIPIAASRDDFEQMMIKKYPAEKQKIKKFFYYCSKLHNELQFLKTEPKW